MQGIEEPEHLCGICDAWDVAPGQRCDSCGLVSPGEKTDPASSPYKALGAEIGRLVEEKQKAYGNSFGKSGQVMRILYPDGIPAEKLEDALTVVRVLDKLFRIATDRDALGESPWRDIAGYSLLSVERCKR